MPIYHHPIDAIGSSGVAASTYVLPPAAISADASNAPIAAGSPNDPAPAPMAPEAAPSDASIAAAQNQLNEALKNTDYKAEITSIGGGHTVLKIVDAETGQVILQMPNQTVLAIIAGLQKSSPNQVADTSLPTGTMVSELA